MIDGRSTTPCCWAHEGTKLFLDAVALTTAPTQRLPGWTRRHLVAHVAANAEALGNLVHWAATGIPTPMYSSPEARAAGIDRGLAMTPGRARRVAPALGSDAWLPASAG